MVEKIKVACAARHDPVNTLIIARTDARAGEGFDSTLRRANAYANAGADILFVEALHSEDEMQKACAVAGKPMMANMADGGKTPILSAKTLQDIGYACAIFPAMTSLVAAFAMEQALTHLKNTGSSHGMATPLFDFQEFCRLIGFEEVWKFEDQWKRAD